MSKAVIKNGKYTIEPLYQWDKNQVLQIYGLSLSRVPEVHFSSVALESALVRQSTMDGTGVITVDIPNSFLQRPYPIKAHICVYEGKTFETLYTIEIPIKPRKMPADYSLVNDTEQYSFNEMNNRLSQAERELGLAEPDSFYKYEYKSNSLVESKVTTTRYSYGPIISASLKAIKSFIDKMMITLTSVRNTADQALATANNSSQIYEFNTFDDMDNGLSNEVNADKYKIGDKLFVIDTKIQWVITEVLATSDLDTGYYYKITRISTHDDSPVVLWTNPDTTVEFPGQKIDLDLSKYKSISILWKRHLITAFGFNETTFSFKNFEYVLTVYDDENDINRPVIITEDGITFGDSKVLKNDGITHNKYIIPEQIIGRYV